MLPQHFCTPDPVVPRRPGLSRLLAVVSLALPMAVLWAVVLFSTSAYAQTSEDGDVRGGMQVKVDGKAVDMPLTDLKVRADIAGDVVTVEVEQTYENPFDARIEAVYTFPLPDDAAVIDMVMVIGDRRIRSDLKEREEARKTYEEARDRGQTTSLLEQERTNIFTQSVANIEPGHPVRVLLTFVEQVPPENGRYAWNFPLVVGPRYVGGSPLKRPATGTGVVPDTTEASDASRITPPILPAGVDAPYLVDFQATLAAGMPIHNVSSSSHDLVADWQDTQQVTLSLPDDQRLPDRDINVQWSLDGKQTVVGTLSHFDDKGGFVSLMIQPPQAVADEDARPKEIVFVVDTSGSMNGQPMDLVKTFMHHALDNLGPDDAFRVVRFDDGATEMTPSALDRTDENVEMGHRFVADLQASGGTDMEAGVRAAFEPPIDGDRIRIVVFLTDGYIGSETRVLSFVSQVIGEGRLFGVGVGSSPNRALMDELAIMGRGASHYVNIDESPDEVVATIYDRMRRPAFTDIVVDWGDLPVESVSPSPIPDVFAGSPIVLTARYAEPAKGEIRIQGLQGTTPTELHLDVVLGEDAAHPAIPHIWARRQVDDLHRRGLVENYDTNTYRDEILALALEHRLLTRFTSFVAVDEKIVANADDPLRTAQVAVMTPHGVDDLLLGIQVSPNYVQPGDPEISVWTPPGATAATAYFPFDLELALTWDPHLERWTDRFLVPRDFPDGEYQILVVVEYDDGRIQSVEVALEVDSTRPVFEAELDPGPVVEVDDLLTVSARILEVDHANVDTELGGEVLPDRIKFVRIHLPDGRVVRMRPTEDDPSLYTFHFRHKDTLGIGNFAFVVETVDVAGNSSFRELRYHVTPKGVTSGFSAM